MCQSFLRQGCQGQGQGQSLPGCQSSSGALSAAGRQGAPGATAPGQLFWLTGFEWHAAELGVQTRLAGRCAGAAFQPWVARQGPVDKALHVGQEHEHWLCGSSVSTA